MRQLETKNVWDEQVAEVISEMQMSGVRTAYDLNIIEKCVELLIAEGDCLMETSGFAGKSERLCRVVKHSCFVFGKSWVQFSAR
jgi:hypothetical protein